MAIATALHRAIDAGPDRWAVITGDRAYRYQDLGEQIQRRATQLQAITPRAAWIDPRLTPCTRRIAVLLDAGLDILVTLVANAQLGGVTLVLNPDWALAQLTATLRHYPPDGLITDARWLPLARALGIPAWDVNTLTQPSDSPQPLPPPPASPIDPTTPFYIGFTSGTTGLPKGIVRHQQSWLDSFAVSRQEFGIQAGDRLLIPGSLAYSLSLFTALDGLQAGATVYLSAPFNPRRAVAQLEQADLTWIVGVPTMVSAIAQVAHRRQCAWPSVRGVICSGSSSPATLWEQVTPVVPNATHYAYYGASELSFVSLWTSQDYPPPASIGRAMAGVRVAILAPDGTPCPPGEVGEIAVQSSMVSLGYLTVGLRWVKGWATVGDRGWMDDQGWIYLAGRPSDRLTTGGLTLYPYPLERALEHRPEIRQAAVIGLPDPQRGDRIVAVVEWQPGACLSRRQLRQWLLTQVPRPHCPQQFYCTPTWPLAPSGKLDRHQLQQWVVANQLDRIG